MRRILLYTLFALILVLGISYSHNALTQKHSVQAQINQAIQKANHPVNIGILVKDETTGKVLYAHNADHYFSPASNEKLLVAYAALSALPEKQAFKTQLFMDSTHLVKGILHDNLYLRFEGDPSFTTAQLDALIQTLAKSGVRTIDGNIVVDDTHFDNFNNSLGSSWDDQRYCWGAPVNTIILDKNCIKTGTSPESSAMASTNPRANFEFALRNLLQKYQITSKNPIVYLKIYNPPTLLVESTSPSTSVLVTALLKNSDNLIADSLFKAIGANATHSTGSFENGSNAVRALLLNELKLDIPNTTLVDGSGRSQYDYVTPEQLVALLAAINSSPYATTYRSALPISGVDGTLRNRMNSPEFTGKVFAKTGSATGVNALSGYIETKQHHHLIFSIMINGFVDLPNLYQDLEDNICEILIKEA